MAPMKKRLGTGKYLRIKHHKGTNTSPKVGRSEPKNTSRIPDDRPAARNHTKIPQGFQPAGRPHKQTRQPHQRSARPNGKRNSRNQQTAARRAEPPAERGAPPAAREESPPNCLLKSPAPTTNGLQRSSGEKPRVGQTPRGTTKNSKH
jgi:hypothetical protein